MSFIEELKRRNVFKVGIAYLVASWLLLQLTEVLTELLELSTDIGKTVIILLVVGFVPALIFAWAFEMTPEGIKREKDVDRSESIAPRTGRKLDYTVIAMLALIAGYFIWEARFKAPASPEIEVATEQPTPATEPLPAEPSPLQETSPLDSDAIAVLPFANRSNIEDDLFFTDGIHDDLLTQLAKIDDLKVISRTSVMEYRDTTMKIPEIAAELGVGKILEGGVQRAGDRVRINAQLIDVATDQHLWAETFDREMTIDNIFDIQSEITRQIVTAVKGELTESERVTLNDRPTDNLAAWESFLHARAILAETDYGADKYQRAEPFALDAVRQDPEFAEAWTTLAGIQMQGIWIGYANTPEQREAVRESLQRAVALAPNSPEVKLAQADYQYRVEVDYDASLALLEQALPMAPGNAELHRNMALSLRRLGRWEASVAAFERTLELDPLNAFAAATLAETLGMMNAWDRLEPLVDFWLRRDPNSSDLIGWKANALVHARGDVDGASTLLENATAVEGMRISAAHVWVATLRRDWDRVIALQNDPSFERGLEIFGFTQALGLGTAYALQGLQETAEGHFESHIDAVRSEEPEGRIEHAFRDMNLALGYAWLGQHEEALTMVRQSDQQLSIEDDHIFGSNLERLKVWVLAKSGERDTALDLIAAKLDAPEGFSRWELHLHPGWDFFRDDPRFNDLVRPDGVDPEPFRRMGDGT
jgi:TolB-like protein